MRDYILFFDRGGSATVAEMSVRDILDCLEDGVIIEPGDNCGSEENFLERCRIELVARQLEGRL